MSERSGGASSPFWSTGKPAASHRSPAQTTKVIGASYSHADMLNMQSLSISGNTLSRTTTGSSIERVPSNNSTASPQPKSKNSASRKTYQRFLSDPNWSAQGNDDERVENFGLEDDEDEFGLPSLTTSRNSRGKGGKSWKTQPSQVSSISYLDTSPSPPPSLTLFDSGDMAGERDLPSYSQPKQSQGKTLRPQYKDIIRDPANSLHLIDHPPTPPGITTKEAQDHSARMTRINKFKKTLQASSVSLAELRDLAWSGIPEEVRAMAWQILLGYLPTSSERRITTLERKRNEYLEAVKQAFEKSGERPATAGSGAKGRSRGLDEAVWHQISIDVPRTNPHLELYAYDATQKSLERILYVWAIRHPASGYVQGMNDLVTPFWQVFLAAYISKSDIETGMDPGQLPKAVLDAVEADSFWCLTKLLDGIQDNYVHEQPGIHRQVTSLRDLTKRIDAGLVNHMDKEGIEFMQFSFRWINCLLMREISVKNVIRMWDTYLAEEQGFSEFHLYVCAAFLVKWSEQLDKMDFQEIMMFLQALPTRNWSVKDIELLLSEAFIWSSLFRGSSAHLRDSSSSRSHSIGH